jgi:hypothetical protein
MFDWKIRSASFAGQSARILIIFDSMEGDQRETYFIVETG